MVGSYGETGVPGSCIGKPLQMAGKGKVLETDDQDLQDVDIWSFGKDDQSPSRRIGRLGPAIVVKKKAVTADPA